MSDQDPALEGADNPEDERPDWLPENFKSPEDLARSYAESQRKITELSQEKKGLEDSVQSLSNQFEEFTAAQNRPDPNAVYAQWQEAFDADPISTMTQIAQQTAAQVHEQYAKQQPQQPSVSPDVVAFIANQQLADQYSDWDAYKEKVGELVSRNPLFARDELWGTAQSATQALDSAYQMVKAQDVLSGNAVAEQQIADTRAMKLNAQSMGGASGRPPAPSDQAEEWARIKAAGNDGYAARMGKS